MVEADLETIIWEISKYEPDIIIADNGDSGNNVLKLINHFGEDKVLDVLTIPVHVLQDSYDLNLMKKIIR